MREWEIWGKDLAEDLTRLWGKPGHDRGRHWELLKRCSTLIEGESILDVGCGQGHFYSFVKDNGIDYLGLDTSESMLEKARSFFSSEINKFKKGDVYDLSNFESRDMVIAISVMVHLPDPLDLPIRQLWSKAKKCLIITVRLGEQHLGKTPGYGTGDPNKYVIRRQDPVGLFYNIFAKLKDLGRIERYFFDLRTEIFKLTRGIKRPKARAYDEWE